jgi:hypothetical protein
LRDANPIRTQLLISRLVQLASMPIIDRPAKELADELGVSATILGRLFALPTTTEQLAERGFLVHTRTAGGHRLVSIAHESALV